MILNITQWNEIPKALDGYILNYIIEDNSHIFGINSNGSKIELARPSGDYWVATSGVAYEAIDDLLREVRDRVKASNDYSRENKISILKQTFEEIIKLYNKDYKN